MDMQKSYSLGKLLSIEKENHKIVKEVAEKHTHVAHAIEVKERTFAIDPGGRGNMAEKTNKGHS